MRKAIRAAGLKYKPITLRAYFSSKMLLAQSEELIPESFWRFWMGRRNVDLGYNLERMAIPEALVEKMRSGYDIAAEQFLSPKPKTEPTDAVKKDTLKGVLKLLKELKISSPEVIDVITQEIEKSPEGDFFETLMDRVLEKIKREGPGATFTSEELVEGFPLPPAERSVTEKDAKGLGERLAKNPRVKVIPSEKVRWRAGPELLKKLGVNGSGNLYDVRVVGKADKKAILELLAQGFSFVQDLGDESVYRKKRE